MIVLLGTSNMIGGHDQNHTDPNTMLHSILAEELCCDVINLATPGRGVERYMSNLLYAKKKYNPVLAICELYIDRTFNNFWFPTANTMTLHKQNANTINEAFVEERSSFAKDKIDHRYIQSRINRNTESKKDMQEFAKKNALAESVPVGKLLSNYRESCVYIDEDYLCALRTIDAMCCVDTLADILGIHILYVALFEPAVAFNQQFINTLPVDRFLNRHFAIPKGVDAVLSTQCNGNYLSHDNDHFNQQAEQILIREYIAPFVDLYAGKNQIVLRN